MAWFFSLLGSYVFYYPLVMSLVWIIGGLFFYFRKERNTGRFPILRFVPKISVLIPARNEADNIRETVQAVLASQYPAMEVIVIDDDSSDGTDRIITKLGEEHENVRGLFLRRHMGKASGLNMAFLMSRGDIIVTIDADCLLDKQALYWIAWHFANFPRVGAVTGNPHVRNRTTLLAQIQTAEYTSVIGLVKRTQRVLGKLLTVSGVIAAFRREALADVGLWSHDMITEDIDITWKLEKRFWDVRYETNAVGWILVPETLKGLWMQRLRWAQGGVETIRRHRGVWLDWRQRRIWPVYIDYVLVIIWSYSFFLTVLYWGACRLLGAETGVFWGWNGSVAAFVCVFQFLVSLSINLRYDKTLISAYFWIIWYPAFYWLFNACATVVGFYKGMTKKFGRASLWQSPDRGVSRSAR
ncbi:MAG: poly-beta-1,6 N-acetyl-D-glucosamine synthase [Acidaminococcales bacterium]|nr:poly-beta-1,6 N-acetyl-D-glucosamine synthase [Acidaminococcales bacterium]MDR3348082.1 poly-beta-1,6 N-acetyl-D-glucosamine synthase [Acidaminococcales bacterium]